MTFIESRYRIDRVGDHAEKVGSGITPRGGESAYIATGVPLIRSQNVRSGQLDLSDVAYISDEQHQKMISSAVQPGDVLLNITGASIGRSCVVPDTLGIANVNQHVCIIRTKPTLDAQYLSSFLNSYLGQKQIFSFQGGGSREGLNYSQVQSLELPVPNKHEQLRIAEMLSAWDEALERLSRQIERKKRLLESIRERLIHGAHRLGGRNSPWPMIALSEVTKQLTERNGARYGRDLVMGVTKAEGIVPMREHVVAENISRYLVLPPNSFAYNPMRINIGSIAMSEHEGDVIVSPDYVVFACKEDRLHPRFLNHLRRTKAWADFMTIAGNGSVRVRIYYASLAEFEFHLPPLDEQRAIVEVLDDAEREITALEAERAALAKQRDALATELLTGRLRVPQAEAAS